jgi:hypothetical protein
MLVLLGARSLENKGERGTDIITQTMTKSVGMKERAQVGRVVLHICFFLTNSVIETDRSKYCYVSFQEVIRHSLAASTSVITT